MIVLSQVKFNISTDLTPKGDQPEAISKLIEGFTKKGYKNQVLLGVTGSGKSLDYADLVMHLTDLFGRSSESLATADDGSYDILRTARALEENAS